MKINLFMPEYMKYFKCIADKCSDTCCAGWDINIDGNTLEKYNNSIGELKQIVCNKYRENEKSEDFFNAGFMVLKDEKRCPFLNDEMLCDIHGNAGEEQLCITCKRYPRVYNIVDEVYEKSGLPSCEEVCNLAFLSKDKMEFIEYEEEVNEEELEIRRIIDTESFEGTDSLLQYFWNLRIITINALQERSLTIEERFDLLENIYKEIELYYNQDDYEKIEELIDNLDIREYFKKIDNTPLKKYSLYKELMAESLNSNIKSFRLKEVIEEYKGNIESEDSFSKFIKVEEELAEVLNTYSYIFENYLVNQVFKDLIPFNKENLTASISKLKVSYLIIKSYSLGILFGKRKEFSEKDIIKVIQGFSKDAEHNKVFEYLFNM